MTFVYRVKTHCRTPKQVGVANARAARVTSVLRCNRLRVSRSHLLGPMNASTGFLCKEMQGTDDNRSIDLAGIVARVCLRAVQDHPVTLCGIRTYGLWCPMWKEVGRKGSIFGFSVREFHCVLL